MMTRASLTEEDIQRATIEHWRALGVPGSLVAAVPNRRAFGQAGLTPGLFDLIVLSPTLGAQTGWLELKTAKGRLSPAQSAFRDTLIGLGTPFAITYGRDEPIKVLEAWGAVRRSHDGTRARNSGGGAAGAEADAGGGLPAGEGAGPAAGLARPQGEAAG